MTGPTTHQSSEGNVGVRMFSLDPTHYSKIPLGLRYMGPTEVIRTDTHYDDQGGQTGDPKSLV